MGDFRTRYLIKIVVMAGALSSCTYSLTLHNKASAPSAVATQISAVAQYGQPDFNTNDRISTALSNPSDPSIVGSKLMIADSANRRVLIWNSIPTSLSQRSDIILGQTDDHSFTTNSGYPSGTVVSGSGYPLASNAIGMNSPTSICSDGTHVAVADSGNNRVLIWNSFPTRTGQSADLVLGQPDFASNAVNFDGTVTAKTMRTPTSVLCAGGKLYVADQNNHRVLIWNSFPTSSYQAADGVLGQPGFVTGSANNGGQTLSRMNSPRGMAVAAGKFILADINNHRILVWNTSTPSSLQAADYVLGQSAANARVVNSGGLSGHSLSSPYSVAVVGSTLYVSDSGNNRVLVWDVIPTVWTTDANRVIGQNDLISATVNSGGISARSLSGPRGVASDGTKLIVADSGNNRMMIFNTIPATNFTLATLTWGQVRVNLNTKNGGREPVGSLNVPFYLTSDGSHFWVSDSSNNRALRWPNNKTPFDGLDPDLVIGQNDLTTTDASVTAAQVAICSMVSDGVKTYCFDASNHRILIYNSYPTSSGVAADAVIGQPDFVSSTANAGGVGPSSLAAPYHGAISGTKLIVADSNNNRVLIWNALPTANTAANVVLGQPDFTTVTANTGGAATGMSNPIFVLVYGGKLMVADRTNNRVLVWNAIPSVSNTPPDYAIGEPDLNTVGSNAGQAWINATGVNNTMSLAYNGKKLFVSDLNNSRILVWNQLPSVSGVPADSVIGQANFTSGTAAYTGISASSVWRPIGLLLNGMDLFVVDYMNSRLLKYQRIDP